MEREDIPHHWAYVSFVVFFIFCLVEEDLDLVVKLLHVVLRYTYNCVSATMLCLCIILTSSITPLPRPLFLIHCYILQIFTFSTTRTCSSQSLCRRNSTIRKLHNLLDQLSWLERPTVNREVISSILISSEHFFFVCPFLFFCLSYTFLEFNVQAINLRNQPLCFIFIVYHTMLSIKPILYLLVFLALPVSIVKYSGKSHIRVELN